MSKVWQVSKESLEKFWQKTIPRCREIIEKDLQAVQNDIFRGFYSQVILNRILLIVTFWQKSLLFSDSKGLWRDDFHKQVMIPFLERLSGLVSANKKILEKFPTQDPGQKSFLFPHGGPWAISDIHISDDAYSSVFAKLEPKITRFGEELLKELFRSDALSESFEGSLTRSRKKAKGIFCTPSYLTDEMAFLAIEKFLVTRLEENGIDPPILNSRQLNNSAKILTDALKDLRILDNAVGCGEYLLSALRFLIPLYKKLLNGQTKEKKGVENHEAKTKALRIILANNLYGVDISPIAVDICRTRLWGIFLLESREGINIWPLPDLDSRIRIGNSLIGFSTPTLEQQVEIQKSRRAEALIHEYYAVHLKEVSLAITNEELDALSVFHWPLKFPSAFKKNEDKGSGFSIIIGNPPFQSTKRGFFSQIEKNAYSRLFKSASRQWDIYELFVERSLGLLQPNGYLCYLLPKPALTNENMEPLRDLVLRESKILEIIDVGMPFQNAGVELIIVLISVPGNKKGSKTRIGSFEKARGATIHHEVPQEVFKGFPFQRFAVNLTELEIDIIGRMRARSVPLSKTISLLTRGIEYGKKNPAINQNGQGLPLLRGEDVDRYCTTFNNLHIHFQKDDPSIFKSKDLYTGQKILLRRVASGLVAAKDENERLFLNTLYGMKMRETSNIPFLLGLLNSKLLNWWFNRVFLFEDNLFPYVRKSQLLELPIRLSMANSLKKKKKIVSVGFFERYKQAISLLTDIIQILISQNETRLSGIIDEEVLDHLVFEFYFFEELDTDLLTITETVLSEIGNLGDSRAFVSNISNILANTSLWTPVRDEVSYMMKKDIFSASIGSKKFRKTWKKIHRNQR